MGIFPKFRGEHKKNLNPAPINFKDFSGVYRLQKSGSLFGSHGPCAEFQVTPPQNPNSWEVWDYEFSVANEVIHIFVVVGMKL